MGKTFWNWDRLQKCRYDGWFAYSSFLTMALIVVGGCGTKDIMKPLIVLIR
jgi:hypothetical protein